MCGRRPCVKWRRRLVLMGRQFTTADILLTTCLTWAMALEASVHDSCRAFLERSTSRDAYRTALIVNTHKP